VANKDRAAIGILGRDRGLGKATGVLLLLVLLV